MNGRPVMQYHFRAGLVGFILAFLLVSTTAAPIQSSNTKTSSLSRPESSPSLVQQSLYDIAHQSNPTPPSAVSSNGGVAAREIVTLYRRRSIFTKIKDAFKHVAQKIGSGISKAVHKVANFVKTTGAKIAKVGLKIWSTVEKGAAKIAQFIPVIGKPLSKAMDAAGTVANKVSDAIHAKIGGKLGHAMNGMSKAQKIMGYVPRELADGFGELDERELYAVNMVLDARESYDFDGLSERGWDEWVDSYIY